jgi:hypothetical protein
MMMMMMMTTKMMVAMATAMAMATTVTSAKMKTADQPPWPHAAVQQIQVDVEVTGPNDAPPTTLSSPSLPQCPSGGGG